MVAPDASKVVQVVTSTSSAVNSPRLPPAVGEEGGKGEQEEKEGEETILQAPDGQKYRLAVVSSRRFLSPVILSQVYVHVQMWLCTYMSPYV